MVELVETPPPVELVETFPLGRPARSDLDKLDRRDWLGSRQARSAGLVRISTGLIGGFSSDLAGLDRRGELGSRQARSAVQLGSRQVRSAGRVRISTSSISGFGRISTGSISGVRISTGSISGFSSDFDRLDRRVGSDLDRLDQRAECGSRQARSAGWGADLDRLDRRVQLGSRQARSAGSARISTGSISGSA